MIIHYHTYEFVGTGGIRYTLYPLNGNFDGENEDRDQTLGAPDFQINPYQDPNVHHQLLCNQLAHQKMSREASLTWILGYFPTCL